MGIYLFNRDRLVSLLHSGRRPPTSARTSSRGCIEQLHVQTHLFDGYWEDLGTIQSYHECHLALAGDNPPFDFHNPDGVVYTRHARLPPRAS